MQNKMTYTEYIQLQRLCLFMASTAIGKSTLLSISEFFSENTWL